MNPSTDIVANENPQANTASALAFAAGLFFSFRIVFTVFSVRVLGAEPQTGAATALALKLCLLGLVCFTLLGSANRTLGSMLQLSSIRWVFAFLALSGCSLMWSTTASLWASTVYWFGTASDVAIVIVLLRTGSLSGVGNSLMKGFVWGACCIALIAWIMPTQYDLRLGDEDFFNSNQIANICALALFFAQFLMRRKEGKFGFVTFFLAVTLLRSLSKTTIVAFVVSAGYLIIQDRSIGKKTKILLTIAFTFVVLVFWGLFEAYYDLYTTSGNQAETLTGRTAIWAYVLNAALEKPWIGHGFDSMWKVIPLFGTFEARHAENELLQVFYCYGVAGVIMLFGVYGSLYRQSRRLSEGPFKVIFVSILFFAVVRGLAEAEPFDLLLPLWTVVMIAMLADSAGGIDRAMAHVLLPVGSDLSNRGQSVPGIAIGR